MSKDIKLHFIPTGENFIDKIRKDREDRYNAMPIEQKIELSEFALMLQLEDGHDNIPISLKRLIELLSEKIKRDHCE